MNWFLLAAGTQAAAAPAPNPMGMNLILILFLGVFWVFMIMPQRKQQKQREQMLKNLKKGDKVITSGGIHGEVVDFDGDDDIKVRVSDKVEMKFTRSSIAKVKG